MHMLIEIHSVGDQKTKDSSKLGKPRDRYFSTDNSSGMDKFDGNVGKGEFNFKFVLSNNLSSSRSSSQKHNSTPRPQSGAAPLMDRFHEGENAASVSSAKKLNPP